MVKTPSAEPQSVDGHDLGLETPFPWREHVLTGALAVLLLLVTKGPLFRLRLELAPVTMDFIDDPWVQAASVSVSLLVIALARPAHRQILGDRTVMIVFAVFISAIAASTLWSVTWPRTIEQAGMLALGTMAALLAGARLGRLRVAVALWSAMQIGVLLSVFGDLRSWPLVRDYNGDLAGIYFNRNSLGPIAVLAAVSSLVLAATIYGRRRPRDQPIVAALGLIAVVDAAVWWMSGSLTPAVAALVAAYVVVVLVFLAPGPDRIRRRRLGITLSGAAVVAPMTISAAWSHIVVDLFGRSTSLSGRTTIWDVVLDFSLERPVQGWGFMAVWRQAEITGALAARNKLVYEAHSGYLEVLLGAGVIGLVALLAVIGVVLARSGAAFLAAPAPQTGFAFGLVVYAALVNLGETYVGANLLPWTLLALVAGQSVRSRPQADAVEAA